MRPHGWLHGVRKLKCERQGGFLGPAGSAKEERECNVGRSGPSWAFLTSNNYVCVCMCVCVYVCVIKVITCVAEDLEETGNQKYNHGSGKNEGRDLGI